MTIDGVRLFAGEGRIGRLAPFERPRVAREDVCHRAIEAVAAAYLQGSPMLARQSAVAATAHANSVPQDSRVEQSVLQVIEQVDDYPPVVADGIRSGPSALGNVMSYLIGGLKNWEQGMLKEADECFSRISSSNITSNEAWFSIYREVAAEYRADYRVLSDNVFLALPDTPAGCQDAISRIDELRKTLKTKGRANYNLRAWQLDLARHAKILARDAAQIQSQSDVPDAELRKVLLQLQRYVMNGEFENASQLLRGADSNLSKAQLDSLGTMADAASTFLTDLEADLSISPAVGVYSMKSGSELNLIQMNALGQINVREKSGGMRVVTLTEVSVDSLVELHRNYMKLPLPEVTKMRRHWSAIAFDWLAGDRKRAVSAAQMLSQSNKDFAMKWAQISAGLPID